MLLSAYALTLPKIPVAEKKATTSLASKLGLDAFVLFKNPRMAIFFLFAMMLGAVLQITNVLATRSCMISPVILSLLIASW
ncbi:xanthosine permease [Escherichia coli]|uniref:Xanthosine permease n=1 Tax=Escherichia coli TaxID=562 RepID=A0A376L8I0_ECOLX|nr:xanthosine permease [Escherichia coli]